MYNPLRIESCYELAHILTNLECRILYDKNILQIRCFDHDEDDENDLIGEFETSLNEMSKASNENENVVCVFLFSFSLD